MEEIYQKQNGRSNNNKKEKIKVEKGKKYQEQK